MFIYGRPSGSFDFFAHRKLDAWKIIHFLLGWYIWYVDFWWCIHHIVGAFEEFSFLLGYFFFCRFFRRVELFGACFREGTFAWLGPMLPNHYLFGGLGLCDRFANLLFLGDKKSG